MEAKRSMRMRACRSSSCNLHGACGGKGIDGMTSCVIQRCNLHGACGGKGGWKKKISAKKTLQSARSVWRQSEKVAGARREITRCNLHGACRETERHHPPKKSEKIYADLLHFYSFWCIIHLVRQTDTKMMRIRMKIKESIVMAKMRVLLAYSGGSGYLDYRAVAEGKL